MSIHCLSPRLCQLSLTVWSAEVWVILKPHRTLSRSTANGIPLTTLREQEGAAALDALEGHTLLKGERETTGRCKGLAY